MSIAHIHAHGHHVDIRGGDQAKGDGGKQARGQACAEAVSVSKNSLPGSRAAGEDLGKAVDHKCQAVAEGVACRERTLHPFLDAGIVGKVDHIIAAAQVDHHHDIDQIEREAAVVGFSQVEGVIAIPGDNAEGSDIPGKRFFTLGGVQVDGAAA